VLNGMSRRSFCKALAISAVTSSALGQDKVATTGTATEWSYSSGKQYPGELRLPWHHRYPAVSCACAIYERPRAHPAAADTPGNRSRECFLPTRSRTPFSTWQAIVRRVLQDQIDRERAWSFCFTA
jgi:hypothetical protein